MMLLWALAAEFTVAMMVQEIVCAFFTSDRAAGVENVRGFLTRLLADHAVGGKLPEIVRFVAPIVLIRNLTILPFVLFFHHLCDLTIGCPDHDKRVDVALGVLLQDFRIPLRPRQFPDMPTTHGAFGIG